MSELNVQQSTSHFSNLLRDLSIELKSKDFEEIRLRLLAFDRIDGVLASLREEVGIQVYRGANVVEEYERSRREEEVPITHHALDYIVRKGNVELQLEVKLPPANGFCITGQSAEQYHRILGANSKTQEIVLVWATEELDSIALGLDDIRNYLLHWRQKAEPIRITEDQLGPLKETIIAAFERHRPIFQKPTDIREMRRIEFDLSEAFSKMLDAKFDDLRDSAERRKARERMLAIRSISESDKKQIQILLSDSQMQDLEFDDLKARIAAICENVELEQDSR